ncbi:MAG: hypothetical protein ACYS1A_15810, partial [Planctomycetota bacterium]
PCTLGRLNDTKEWFVTTPAVALLTNGKVKSVWEEKAPDLGRESTGFGYHSSKHSKNAKNNRKFVTFINKLFTIFATESR